MDVSNGVPLTFIQQFRPHNPHLIRRINTDLADVQHGKGDWVNVQIISNGAK